MTLDATILIDPVGSAFDDGDGECAGLRAVEAALEAWAECNPIGFTLPESRALALLLTLGARLPSVDGHGIGDRAQLLEAILRPLLGGPCSNPEEELKLCVMDGQVQFLHFWRAFGVVLRLVGVEPLRHTAASEGLVAELEDLRDVLLDGLAAEGRATTAPAVVRVAVDALGPRSVCPEFWRAVGVSLQAEAVPGDFQLDDLTVFLLSWLHDAAMWQSSPAQTLQTQTLGGVGTSLQAQDFACNNMRSAMLSLDVDCFAPPLHHPRSPSSSLGGPMLMDLTGQFPGLATPRSAWVPSGEMLDASRQSLSPVGSSSNTLGEALQFGRRGFYRTAMLDSDDVDCTCTPALMSSLAVEACDLDATLAEGELKEHVREGLAVYLHIYDVSHEASIQRLNAVLAHRRSPLKFGGVFHTGVEVVGLEWSFGWCEEGSGVRGDTPRSHEAHHFRQTVELPYTRLPEAAIFVLIEQLQWEYAGQSYDLLRRNCCHFADDLCQRLGVGRIPGWIYRLARIGVRLDAVLRRIPARRNSYKNVEERLLLR